MVYNKFLNSIQMKLKQIDVQNQKFLIVYDLLP